MEPRLSPRVIGQDGRTEGRVGPVPHPSRDSVYQYGVPNPGVVLFFPRKGLPLVK